MATATDAAKSALQSYQSLGSDQAMQQADAKYGVGDSQTRLSALKGIVGNLQSQVEAVDPSVTGRTSGTFTTEGQRQALVAKESAPILGNLGKQQSALTSEQQDLTSKQGLASAMASALLSDDKARYQRLLDQYNAATAEDSAVEQKRQFEVTKAEQARQFNVQAAQSAKNAAKSATGSSSTPSVSQFLVQAFSGYQPGKSNFYTEREVIPALMANYGLTKSQAEKYAYDYRQQVYGKK
jgi:hypothetical protein